MGFYTGDDLPYHYWLATEFAISDAWFNPAPTRTQPNRYYLMGLGRIRLPEGRNRARNSREDNL